jgi:hypothetical protein
MLWIDWSSPSDIAIEPSLRTVVAPATSKCVMDLFLWNSPCVDCKNEIRLYASFALGTATSHLGKHHILFTHSFKHLPFCLRLPYAFGI